MNASVSEMLGGGARATYFVPVTSIDLPSDHVPIELTILTTPVRRRRTVPWWAPLHPLYQRLMAEGAEAIFAGTSDSFAAIAELSDVAFSILLEVTQSSSRLWS